MRFYPTYLIGRLFFLPGFWGILILLFIMGGIVNLFDTGPHDYVCFGDEKYDYLKPADRQKLSEDMAAVGASQDLLQVPPCNLFGSRWYPPEERAAMLKVMNEMAEHPERFKLENGHWHRVKGS